MIDGKILAEELRRIGDQLVSDFGKGIISDIAIAKRDSYYQAAALAEALEGNLQPTFQPDTGKPGRLQ